MLLSTPLLALFVGVVLADGSYPKPRKCRLISEISTTTTVPLVSTTRTTTSTPVTTTTSTTTVAPTTTTSSGVIVAPVSSTTSSTSVSSITTTSVTSTTSTTGITSTTSTRSSTATLGPLITATSSTSTTISSTSTTFAKSTASTASAISTTSTLSVASTTTSTTPGSTAGPRCAVQGWTSAGYYIASIFVTEVAPCQKFCNVVQDDTGKSAQTFAVTRGSGDYSNSCMCFYESFEVVYDPSLTQVDPLYRNYNLDSMTFYNIDCSVS